MTQEMLAEKIEVSPQYISDLESEILKAKEKRGRRSYRVFGF